MVRRHFVSIAALLLLVPFSSIADEPSPNVTDAEVAVLVKEVDLAQQTLLGLISGMTDEQWNFKQNPNRWSTGECVEHIARTEVAILNAIKAVVAGPSDPQWYEKTRDKNEFVRKTVLARNPGGAGSLFKAGGEVLPSENWDRARGIEEFYKAHGTLRAYIETMPRDIKDNTFRNPFPSIDWLNCHDWLLLANLHVRRHSLQIGEIIADPNYPKNTSATGGE